MAEVAVTTVLEAVRGALIESISLPGARTLARLATRVDNPPDLKLNLSLLVEGFLQLLASGLGTLALVWATVVLLGGFSTMLVRADFWFITAIVFVETARIVGYNSAPEAKFFVDALAVFSKKKIMRVGRTTNFVRLALGPTWIALAPIFAATACISVSIIRIVGIARHPYRGSGTTGGSDGSNGNLVPALILFYTLVLTQGALFVLWIIVAVNRLLLADDMSSQLNVGRALIDGYVNSIAATCVKKGVSATLNSNLVLFAAELLQSQQPDDIASAASDLHLLLVNNERSLGVVDQICSSEKLVYRLVWLLRSKDLYPDVRACIAQIVCKLAHRLRLADIPGGAQCISSLLDPHLMKNAAQTGHKGDDYIYRSQRRIWRADTGSTLETVPLIVHGLLILDELTDDPENCTEIHDTTDLVAKIVAPVSSGLHVDINKDIVTAAIVRASLRVVAKLTRGTSSAGESSKILRRGLVETYGSRTDKTILWILSNSSDQEMRMLAVEILLRLPLDKSRMLEFVAELQRLFFHPPRDSPLRITAGKALTTLIRSRGDKFADKFPDIQQMLAIMSNQAKYTKGDRAVAAGMLAQICAKSRADEDRNRLRSVFCCIDEEDSHSTQEIQHPGNRKASALSTVLEAIVTETANIAEPAIREFLASFLGLAVQICEKLTTAEDFSAQIRKKKLTAAEDFVDAVVKVLPTFSEKMKAIIETTSDGDDEACLAIMKAATKLVTWMMQIDISPGYVQYFQKAEIADKLDAAVKDMAHLERYVGLATVAGDEIEGYETLQALVETARKILVSPQQQ